MTIEFEIGQTVSFQFRSNSKKVYTGLVVWLADLPGARAGKVDVFPTIQEAFPNIPSDVLEKEWDKTHTCFGDYVNQLLVFVPSKNKKRGRFYRPFIKRVKVVAQ